MLMDNGTPWAVTHRRGGYTKLSVWLLRHNIRVIHGRPYHPETQGKEERFHRTLQAEVLRGRAFANSGEGSGSSIVGVRRITTSVLTRPWG